MRTLEPIIAEGACFGQDAGQSVTTRFLFWNVLNSVSHWEMSFRAEEKSEHYVRLRTALMLNTDY